MNPAQKALWFIESHLAGELTLDEIAGGAPDILSLALEADYGSHEAFTRAFRDHFGVTPEAVRSSTCLDKLTLQEAIVMDSTPIDNLQAPRFETGKPLLVAGLGERYNWES